MSNLYWVVIARNVDNKDFARISDHESIDILEHGYETDVREQQVRQGNVVGV